MTWRLCLLKYVLLCIILDYMRPLISGLAYSTKPYQRRPDPKIWNRLRFFLHDKSLVFWPTETSLWACIRRPIQATTLPLWRRDESWQPTQCHTLVPPKYSRLNWSETTAGFWKCAGHWKRPLKEALHTGPQAVSRCQSTHQSIRKRPVQNRE